MNVLKTTLPAWVALAGPWLLTSPPLWMRCTVILGVGVAGASVWWYEALRSFLAGRQPDFPRAWTAAWALTGVLSAAWISVLSYSAQISIVPSWVIYSGLGGALLLILGTTWKLFPDPKSERPWVWTVCLGALLMISILAAPPGRRFSGGRNHERIRAFAEGVQSPRDAVDQLHAKVVYKSAPFTDTAPDTLRRGAAKCGGMANVLDKVLKAAGFRSRIVHFEGPEHIHTLVEFFDPEQRRWILADAQHNLTGLPFGLSGENVVTDPFSASLPEAWRGYDELFIYLPRGGYVRVTEKNRDRFYTQRTPPQQGEVPARAEGSSQRFTGSETTPSDAAYSSRKSKEAGLHSYKAGVVWKVLSW